MMTTTITLDVLIATYGSAGMARLAKSRLPRLEGVRYVVTWQRHDNLDVPESLQRRADVEVYRTESIGLSNNRHAGLEYARADVVYIADDDIDFYAAGLEQLMRTYAYHPHIDLIAVKSVHDKNNCYPASPTRLQRKLPKGYYVTSFELSFRRRCDLHFCPELGLNSPRMHGGEDEMLLHSAIRRGFNCWFWPITVCEHDHPSTGTKASFTDANLRAIGCVIALTYGWQALMRVPLKAWRVWRRGQASPCRALYYMVQGMIESRGVLRRHRDSFWP